jgi:Guanine nucleotide exchange factor synembryn
MLLGQRKQDEITNLMSQLVDNLKSGSLSPHRLDEVLAQLKSYGRDPRNADSIFSRAGISTLGAYSFGHYPPNASREASRCIANALLLVPALRQEYAALGFAEKAAEKLKIQDDEDEFLMSRTLFLLTFETKVDLDRLITTYSLADSINTHLARHGRQLLKEDKTQEPSPINSMALIETLKLIFSLSNALPNQLASFSPAIGPLFQILQEISLPDPPLQPPMSSTIHALANLEFSQAESDAPALNIIFPPSTEHINIDRLITILSKSILAYKPIELENSRSSVIPLLTVLRKIYDVAPRQSKQYLQELLLPSKQNRDLPIGQLDDLPSRLLRLTISSGLLNLSESISALMFELSNKDANLYVRNVGYGFAAGYLVSHNIPVPDSAKEAQTGSSAEQTEVLINPVTGQRLDKEVRDDGPAMTKEEKEREAERLFVLFERLKATGVVDVGNPLQRAMEEGRLDQRVEELSDSD